MTTPLVIGVLGSGQGSNYGAIASAIADGKLNARVGIVISDVPDAGILALAKKHGDPARHFEPGKFKTKLAPEREAELVRVLQAHGVQLLVLAGFMRVIKEPLLTAFANRIVNIHPSLLPKYPGLAAWRQALEAGEKETGCTVHWVNAGVDTGPVLARQSVPVAADDTAETLHARIHEAEHSLYPQVIGELAARWSVQGPDGLDDWSEFRGVWNG